MEQTVREHPNLARTLFRNLKKHLPLGIGEEQVKDALAENLPEWLYDLTENDLREFIWELQKDPDFYKWMKFNLKALEKILYGE